MKKLISIMLSSLCILVTINLYPFDKSTWHFTLAWGNMCLGIYWLTILWREINEQ